MKIVPTNYTNACFMNSYSFIKKDGNWQLHFSNYTNREGKNGDIELNDGAESILNLLSEGNNQVNLVFDKKPFQDADEIELLQTCEPFLNGGYYLLRSYQGKEINYEMWLSDLTKYVFEETPQKIYFKKRLW
jgi:hypothetical protein